MKYSRLFTPHILIGSNLIHFFHWVFKLNFSLKAEAVIRLLISFFILLMLTPFRIIEAILFFFTKKVEVKQPIFIIGHPRSGTTFFHDSLNEMDHVAVPRMIDCLFPLLNKHFELILVPILRNALPETRLMDKMKVSWDSPQEEEFGMALMSMQSGVNFLFAPKSAHQVLNQYVLLKDANSKSRWLSAHLKFARKIQSMNQGKTLVFKSPGNTARVAELLEIYPDAKFIHIVRDPQDVIRSTQHLYEKVLPEFSLQNEAELDVLNYVFDYYETVMNKFLQSKNTIPENQFFEFKYEDFVEQPIKLLEKAFFELKMPFSAKEFIPFFESRKNYHKNSFEKEAQLSETIRKRCRTIIEEYHYFSSKS